MNQKEFETRAKETSKKLSVSAKTAAARVGNSLQDMDNRLKLRENAKEAGENVGKAAMEAGNFLGAGVEWAAHRTSGALKSGSESLAKGVAKLTDTFTDKVSDYLDKKQNRPS